jgi:hypothetical protein
MVLTGCTRVTVQKVNHFKEVTGEKEYKGVRYYRPKPYLFIKPGSPAEADPPKADPPKADAPKAVTTMDQETPFKLSPASFGNASELGVVSFRDQENEGTGTADGTLPQKPNIGAITGAPGSGTTGTGSNSRPSKISIDMVYMPDFAEEYAVELKPGLGIGELNMTLEDGWNLTNVGIKTDQQTDEILSSVAEVVDATAGFGSKGGDTPSSALYATNVPFGFYEAVIATDPCGKKQLYGWRYVGFMPFQSCPVQPSGQSPVNCNCGEIFGLVFVDGILQFARIGEIPQQPVAMQEDQDRKAQTPQANTSTGQ